MSIKLIAKDDFPRPAAAPWLIAKKRTRRSPRHAIAKR
jgi:hypothetical protein